MFDCLWNLRGIWGIAGLFIGAAVGLFIFFWCLAKDVPMGFFSRDDDGRDDYGRGLVMYPIIGAAAGSALGELARVLWTGQCYLQ